MKDWIMELCPEIAEWQAELIAGAARQVMLAEREVCAKMADAEADEWPGNSDGLYASRNIAAAIRARGEK